ncbi:uncharacterized protein LOC119602404 [Lucilia sericata]|uniref:uncharacterized protein LOC119602404 n=1 Tax=Lucilia sericata TaxID=13632 RepID=UPI0018A876A6|nr:uncharacterized protein LOC119602404 [Lucilia sericata]
MNKGILILACLVVLIAYTEATSPARCRPVCRKNVPSVIRCVRDGKVCRKIRQCTLREENCRRSLLNRPRLTSTRRSLCRNIKSPLGSGPCALRRRPRATRPECNRIRCTIPSKRLDCYRSRRNNCRLLTSCQLARANCRRGRGNALRRTDSRACAGLKRGGRYQKCRPIPKSG